MTDNHDYDNASPSLLEPVSIVEQYKKNLLQIVESTPLHYKLAIASVSIQIAMAAGMFYILYQRDSLPEDTQRDAKICEIRLRQKLGCEGEEANAFLLRHSFNQNAFIARNINLGFFPVSIGLLTIPPLLAQRKKLSP
ncbi:MAG: hypothetical protein ACOYK8_01110 [Alphaproteobacteria bacterium]